MNRTCESCRGDVCLMCVDGWGFLDMVILFITTYFVEFLSSFFLHSPATNSVHHRQLTIFLRVRSIHFPPFPSKEGLGGFFSPAGVMMAEYKNFHRLQTCAKVD